MGPTRRKVPFSGKQKKAQLKERKLRMAEKHTEKLQEGNLHEEADVASVGGASLDTCVVGGLSSDRYSTFTRQVKSINQQPRGRDGRGGRNRFNLQFDSEKIATEKEKGKQAMYKDVVIVDPESLEYTSQDFFPDGLTFPERPVNYQTMTKEQLEMVENKSVRLYAEEMRRLFCEEDINLYEQNVETWRQLWRVFDKSDVLLFIVDIRFAVAQFPPYVYRRLAAQGRGVLLVLNKVDLVSASVVLALKQYFENSCPGLQVLPFCSHECLTDRHRKTKLALQSCRGLVEAVERAAPRTVDLSSWKYQLEKEAAVSTYDSVPAKENSRRKHYSNSDDEEEEDNDQPEGGDENAEEECDVQDAGRGQRAFTIGTIGYPNVGKSSLLNAIMGKSKVGVSRTPGFTKHFQTHYLTPAKDLMLCDCPGLIFPAICPYNLQVLSGTFPISQVPVPMAVVGFLASHINITRVLGLKPLQEHRSDPPNTAIKWTPYSISEAWAHKRQFHVKGRGGQYDTSRAANELLRLSLTGKNNLVLALLPKGYNSKKAALEAMSEEIAAIRRVQGVHATEAAHMEKVLSFEPIPRGTKPSDACMGSMGSAGQSLRGKSHRGMTEETVNAVAEEDLSEENEEEDEEESEELEDEHESDQDLSEEEADDKALISNSADENCPEKAVFNKFSVLGLVSEESE